MTAAMRRLRIALVSALALAAGPAFPQAQPGHTGHAGHESAAGQSRSMPAAQDGGWDYGGRDNPKPATRNRWIMIPGESGAMYRSAAGMSPADRCRALLGSSRIIVDAETRAACGDAAPAAAPAEPVHTDHSQHR